MTTSNETSIDNRPKALTPRRRFLRDQRGAGLVEYVMLAGLIAIAAIAAFRGFGKNVKDTVTTQGTTVTTLPTTEQ